MLVVREQKLYQVQLGRFRLQVRKEKCLSKGGLVVLAVTRGRLDQPLALCFKEQTAMGAEM